MIYSRLVRTIAAMWVASQSYLRAALGVGLGAALPGEALSPAVLAGIFAMLAGVVLINRPGKRVQARG